MEKIRFGAMCEKLFLKPLVGQDDDVLYFSESQVISAGLALSGFRAGVNGLKGRAVLLGKEEIEYLKSLPDSACEKRLAFIMDAELIVLTDTALEDRLTKAAARCGTKTVLSLKPASVSAGLSLYIEGKLNTVEMIHGELLDVFGVGTLIIGEPGAGKSEIALDLITRGHLLVADDAVAVRREGNTLIGCSPSITRHLMEIRGIGLIDVRAMFGAGAIKIEQEIDIAVNLEAYSDIKDYAGQQWFTLNGVSVPLIDLPLRHGRNISALIEVAARNLRLKATGHDAVKELNRRIEKSNSEKKNE